MWEISYLKQIINEIIETGVKEENIIYINFELSDYSMDKFNLLQNGIIHINIIDWLLNKI